MPSAPTSKSPRSRVIFECRANAVGVLFDPAQLLAEPIISCRQRRAKRPIQPRPGGHGTRARLFDHDFAGAIEANDPRHFDAHGLIEGDTGTAQHGGELRMVPRPTPRPVRS